MNKQLIFFLLIFSNVICFSQTKKATKNEALLYILIVNKNDKPIVEKITIHSVKTNKDYIINSNSTGIAEILVPKNDTYIINLELEPNYDKIVIPDKEFYTLNYKIFYDKDKYKKATNTTIHFVIKQSDGSPISEDVTLTSEKTKLQYFFKTDIHGKADIIIPNNDSYIVNLKSAPEYARIEVPNILNQVINYTLKYEGSYTGAIYPSLTKALFTFTFIDLDSIPVPNENFYLISKNNGAVYKTTTDKKGKSHLLVPIGDTYNISSEYFKNFKTKTVSTKQSLYEIEVTLMYISSIEFLRQKAEQEKILKERELRWEEIKKEFGEYVKKDDGASSFDYAQLVNNNEVSSVLNRNKQWKNKLIILDVTGSMGPYNDIVEKWYKLNYTTKDPIQFVLFNDGDNRPDSTKIIGKTGGIHYCKYCNIKTFTDSLKYARLSGNGGDPAENDLEAIIAAINNCSNYTDIILVADNLSPVKDIELLHLINKPIKIILCGTNSFINTEYLDIAYHTNGSIHTIEEDIVNISSTIEGAKIKVLNNYFILTNGKFVYYKFDNK